MKRSAPIGLCFSEEQSIYKSPPFCVLNVEAQKSDKKALCVNGCFSRSGHNFKMSVNVFFFMDCFRAKHIIDSRLLVKNTL